MDSSDKCLFLSILVIAVCATVSLGLYNYLGTMKDPVAQRISAVSRVVSDETYKAMVLEVTRAPTNSANLEAK